MSKHKYAGKIVQNDLQQCINSFERMKRGGIGIADECVEDTCKRALKYIDELEAKLAESEPVRHGHWNTGYFHDRVCSCCLHPDNDLSNYAHSYCPNCGAKMDEQEGKR
ncbi:MAG: hypothetical protein ACI4I1_08260 [Oscillospiraceae bacterium]